MKIRSKALWQYLSETGALNGTEEDIIAAKKRYRKEYKKNWKKSKIICRHELRPAFTPREFKEIQLLAYNAGLKPTAFVRQLVINSLSQGHIIPQKDKLLKVLQLVSMAARENEKFRSSQASILLEAEALLLSYLNCR